MVKKLFCIILALLMLFVTLVGCKKDMVEDEQTEAPTTVFINANDIAEYTLIRAESADKNTIAAASKLFFELKGKYGDKIKFSTDYAKTENDIPTDTKEILIGHTNRAESTGVRYLDYEIGYRNGRIVINGGNSEMIASAVDYFIDNCIADGGVTIPVEYSTTNIYPMDNMKVDGVLLRNFSVREIEGELDDTLKEYLGSTVGIYSQTLTGNEIILKTDRKYGVTEIDIYMDGGNLVIANSIQIGDCSLALECFMEQFESLSTEQVVLAGRVELVFDGYKSVTNEDVAALRAQTDARIVEIRSTANMLIPQGARVFYVSNNGNDNNDGKSPEKAWKTLNKVNSASVTSGSYVCFERGGLWRGQIVAKANVTYTAYGTGEKPKIYGSPENGADPSKWKKAATNIWYYEGSQNWKDVGTLVFNEGESCAIKAIREWKDNGDVYNWTTGLPFNNGYKDLNTDLHFYHDKANNSYLYLYSEENPGNRFESIEFNVGQNLVDVKKNNNVTVDNLCLKFTGVHGVGAGTVSGLTVQNCELGWIGGSNQGIIQDRKFETRFGNGVEIYGGCEDYTVQNNYIYQIYDSGITHQYSGVGETVYNHTNVSYLNNVLDYCGFPIEYFVSMVAEGNPSTMTNLLIEGNHMWYSGYGFSEQRPPADRSWGASIKGHAGEPSNRADGYVIKNNILAFRKDRFLSIISSLTNPDGSDSMPTMEGNLFVEVFGVKFGRVKQADYGETYREDVMYDFNVLDYIEERTFGRSSGNQVWFCPK